MKKLLIGMLACILVGAGPSFEVPLHAEEPPIQQEAPPVFLFSWNIQVPWGYGIPNAIAADSSGNIYVGTAEGGTFYIFKYDFIGTLLTQWTWAPPHDISDIYGIAFDSSGNVYLADRFDWLILKYSSDGLFINDWINPGWEGGLRVINPIGIAIDASDNLYVLEFPLYDSTIFVTKFAPGGLFVTRWGINGTDDPAINLWNPRSIAVDSSSSIYVTDVYNNSVHKFNSNGTPITRWGSEGSGAGEFVGPHGIAVDPLRNVYVCDPGNLRVQKFDQGGNFLTEWRAEDTGYGSEFRNPIGVAVGLGGNIYILDTDRMVVFGPPLNIGSVEGSADPVQVNNLVNVGSTFEGESSISDYNAVWEWGDGTSSPGVISEGSGLRSLSSGGNSSYTVSGSHLYTNAGVFTVVLTVTDNYGRSAQSVYQYVVVYDPSSGFLTGGGWINSPPGAYGGDPELAGKVTMGFEAKYKKDDIVPTGSTEIQFHAAGMNFHSEGYEWLVINQVNATAQLKGSGTINGSGNFHFMVWAVDGNPDLFRVKIWGEDNSGAETVIYDNGENQPTGGGNIKIHNK